MKYLFTLSLFFVSSCSLHAQEKKDLNLDFERMTVEYGQPSGWQVIGGSNPDEYSKTHYIDSSVVQHGKYAYMISLNKGDKEFTGCIQAIKKVYKAKFITLSGYLKTEDVDGMVGLWLRIDDEGGSPIMFDNMGSQKISGTTGWKKYSIKLPYQPEKARKVVFGALIAGSGKLWVDNLELLIDGKTPVSDAKEVAAKVYPAEKDIEHRDGSGIEDISLTDNNKKRLINLGMLWGFIKYHHPAVRSGNYNMDAELFRILPDVLKAKTDAEAYVAMEKWVDKFGQPDPCKKCITIGKKVEVKMMPDYGYLFNENNLPQTLISKLKYIRDNLEKVDKQYYLSLNPYVSNASFDHEYQYRNMTYPDAGIRLLALYRYWNMIQYFFPNRHLTGTKWSKVLGKHLSDFCNAKDSKEYVLACTKLIVAIDDSHGMVGGIGSEVRKQMQGNLSFPFIVKYIENQLVITQLFDKEYPEACKSLQVGDVIVKIDGKNVNGLIEEYKPLTPGSNFDVKMRNMLNPYAGWLVLGKRDNADIVIKREEKIKNLVVERYEVDDSLKGRFYHGYNIKKPYWLLNENTGYIFVNTFRDEHADSILTAFKNTKGVIIDMRGYPKSRMAYGHVNLFKGENTPFVKITTPDASMPGLFTFTSTLSTGGKNNEVYKGKLIILVNEISQSASEFATMSFQTVPGAMVIGSTTSGADGNVVSIYLPGGVRTMISGIGCIYPDGTESQRLGVKIDKVVKPTIKGIKEGRDEVLEEAIRIINEE